MAASRSWVRLQSAASSRLGTPAMVSAWISPNQPSPITPMRRWSMKNIPLKILERQLSCHDDVAGGQPAIDGDGNAGDRARRIGGKKRDDASHLVRLDDAAEWIPA